MFSIPNEASLLSTETGLHCISNKAVRLTDNGKTSTGFKMQKILHYFMKNIGLVKNTKYASSNFFMNVKTALIG
jgi:hypothetical protein